MLPRMLLNDLAVNNFTDIFIFIAQENLKTCFGNIPPHTEPREKPHPSHLCAFHTHLGAAMKSHFINYNRHPIHMQIEGRQCVSISVTFMASLTSITFHARTYEHTSIPEGKGAWK